MAEMDVALEIIKSTWNIYFPSSPRFIWGSKLRNVKNELKKWTKEHYQNPNMSKLMKMKDLGDLQQSIEEDKVTEELLRKEKELEKEIQVLDRKEEEEWRLHSRSLWIESGDTNTKFFHNQCMDRR